MSLQLFSAMNLMSVAEGGVGRSGIARALVIIRTLIDHPMTTTEASQAWGIHLPQLRLTLQAMHRLGLLRISGWKQHGRSIDLPVWSGDEGDDVPRPLTRGGTPSAHPGALAPRHKLGVDLVSLGTMVRLLRERPATVAELAEEAGVQLAGLYATVNHMRDLGLIHVASWERSDSNRPVASYSWGLHKPDARRPSVRERNIRRCREFRERKREAELQRQITMALVAPRGAAQMADSFCRV